MGREGITTHLSDEIRQGPQKDDDEQQGDPDEILPSVVHQDVYGLGGIAEGVGRHVAERIHLLVVKVAD